MPLPTPNRGYPYPIATDPADTAGSIQALAEAINDDVDALQDLVAPRPMARLRGSTTVVNQQAIVPSDLPLETIDFNVGGAIAPITNGRATILLPGAWLMFATLVYPAAIPAANVDYVSLQIHQPQTNSTFAVNSVHTTATLAEIQRNIDVGAFVWALPGDLPLDISLRSEVGRTAGLAQYPLRERTLTLIRMTES
mgnify:CR=1 FL=1